MKTKPHKRKPLGLTLVDLLVVIAIVFVTAILLLPTSHRGGTSKIAASRYEMCALAAAIKQYTATYNHLPIANPNTNSDITFGIDSADITGFQKVSGTHLVTSNSDLMIVLMDVLIGVNADHKLNPQQHVFLTPKMVKDPNQPGVSIEDYQYRDPWGHPYIISLDANQDDRVRDACYASATVSSNVVGVDLTNSSGIYELVGNVMIWSRGPDGQASVATPANAGVNKDNILGWR